MVSVNQRIRIAEETDLYLLYQQIACIPVRVYQFCIRHNLFEIGIQDIRGKLVLRKEIKIDRNPKTELE